MAIRQESMSLFKGYVEASLELRCGYGDSLLNP
jgi:hypothetical protein